MMNIKQTTDYDIVIIGAGIVGLSAALALSRLGCRIAVVEKESKSSHWDASTPYDLRVSALTNNSIRWLKSLNIWKDIEAKRAQSIKAMHVWAEGSETTLQLSAKDAGLVSLGAIVENTVTHSSLLKACEANAQIHLFTPYALNELVDKQEEIEVVLDKKIIRTNLVLGTDGAYSKVRALTGIGCRESAYGEQAIVANVKSDKPHLKSAYQRFLKTGPLAFLPLKDGYSYSIVWSAKTEHSQALLALNEEDFCLSLEAAIEHRLGKLRLISDRKAFPLIKRHATAYGKPGILLLGDAAHTIHPLAGLGLNLGLADAMELEAVIKRALDKKRPLKDISILRRYEQRRAENEWVQEGMDWIKLFYTQDNYLKIIREYGTTLLNKFSCLKSFIIFS